MPTPFHRLGASVARRTPAASALHQLVSLISAVSGQGDQSNYLHQLMAAAA
jgi:hypothetical protein